MCGGRCVVLAELFRQVYCFFDALSHFVFVAGARWFLEVCFHGLFTYGYHFEYCNSGNSKHITWEAQCLHFSTLSTLETVFAAWGDLGGSWEQQEGHVGSRG